MILLALALVLPADADPRADMASRVMAVDPNGDIEPGGGVADSGGDADPGGNVCAYPVFRDPRWHAAVQADLPPRTVGWDADLLQQLSRVDPGRVALRSTPGVLATDGGLFIAGTPAGDRTVRLDGIELMSR